MLINCNKDSNNNSIVVSTYIDIAYNNYAGNDLLDTSTLNHFIASNIKVFTINNEKKTEINNINMSYPHDFFIYKNDSLKENLLRLFFENDTTLLQLSQNSMDTITVTIDKSNGNTLLNKVWYNGVLKWDGGYHIITIVK